MPAEAIQTELAGVIIVVEDNEPVRKSLTMLLRTRGYVVEAFETGLDLLNAATFPDADCFLIDFKMPALNGVELLEKLREMGRAAPAIMITGTVTNDLRDKALAAGFLGVVEKPPERLALVDQVANAIAGHGNTPTAA